MPAPGIHACEAVYNTFISQYSLSFYPFPCKRQVQIILYGKINVSTVESLITHTPRWTIHTMCYRRLCILRGQFWCKTWVVQNLGLVATQPYALCGCMCYI